MLIIGDKTEKSFAELRQAWQYFLYLFSIIFMNKNRRYNEIKYCVYLIKDYYPIYLNY